MQIHNFEERIKSIFGRHRPEVDTDEIWRNIEPRLKKKKRRFILFFWLLGLGLLGFFWWKNGLVHPPAPITGGSPAPLSAQKVAPSRPEKSAAPLERTSLVPNRV